MLPEGFTLPQRPALEIQKVGTLPDPLRTAGNLLPMDAGGRAGGSRWRSGTVPLQQKRGSPRL